MLRFPHSENCGPADTVPVLPTTKRRLNQSLTVLVADDNVDAAGMLCRLLEADGHTVKVVHDGLKAVQQAKELQPDLIILDIGMPGLNGYEVAVELRRLAGLEHSVLVALTGWGGHNDRTRSRQAGFDAHLTKPAGLAEIHQLVAKLIKPAGMQ